MRWLLIFVALLFVVSTDTLEAHHRHRTFDGHLGDDIVLTCNNSLAAVEQVNVNQGKVSCVAAPVPTPTNTPSPTLTPTSTNTPLPPTATPTGSPPTATPTSTSPPEPTPTATQTPLPPTPTVTPTGGPASSSVLVSGYVAYGDQPEYERIRYRPRQYTVGVYTGWDWLNPPDREINTTYSLNPFFELTLQRAATVGIVWRAGGTIPNWLNGNGWARSPNNAGSFPVYLKDFPAGVVSLGGVNNPGSNTSRTVYLVLVAEPGGIPSTAPVAPIGLEQPQPNATCPAWVHAQYVVNAPNGVPFPTWHPQIDPVYWCYFHHEHGSHPGAFMPAFGYSAQVAQVPEAHEGFKVFRYHFNPDKYLSITMHFGTANAMNAVCVRFHELSVIAVENGVRMAEVYFMADNGASRSARTGNTITPAACPNQSQVGNSFGAKQFQVVDDAPPVGYEPWQMDLRGLLLSIPGGHTFTVNTPSRITDCNNLTCSANVNTGDQGEFRFMTNIEGFGIRHTTGPSGVFWTDAYGKTIQLSTPNVQQFIDPDADFVVTNVDGTINECYQTHPFGGDYNCQNDESILNSQQNVEAALRSPN